MPQGAHLIGLSKEERKELFSRNRITEHKGFKLGQEVRLKIEAVPQDHKAEIEKIKKEPNTGEICFWVNLTSKTDREANGNWGPLWINELEKV